MQPKHSTNSSLIGTCLEDGGSSPKSVSNSRISSFDYLKSCLFNMYFLSLSMMSPISYLLINTRGQLSNTCRVVVRWECSEEYLHAQHLLAL